MAMDNCADCFYAGYLPSIKMYCCRYYLMTNERRPCPGGDGCTVKVGKVSNWKSGWKRKKVKTG